MSESNQVPPAEPTVWEQITTRLLALPHLTANELRDRNVDPDQPYLIRLCPSAVNRGVKHRHDNTCQRQYPSLQFLANSGAPRSIVLRVNKLLGADTDPWGVTDWWTGGHTQLDGAAPASLLGGASEYTVEVLARDLIDRD